MLWKLIHNQSRATTMASIESIQTLMSKEDCEKILRRSLDSPAHLLSFKITKFDDNVAGFLGDHLTLTIRFATNNTKSQTTYFLKTLPQFNNNQLDYVLEAGIFKKEVVLYQNLLSELLKIGHFGPRCFFVKDNVIVLENMNAKGFKMNPKVLYMTEDHCVAMLKTVAKYHASTLIYEHKRGLRLDEKFKYEIRETCFSFVEGQPRYKWLVSATKCATDLIRLMSLKKHDVDAVCESFHRFIFEEMEQIISPSRRFRNVLSHDDLWCNNLLFNDHNECVLVDFQLVRYTPPCMDFLTSLYLNLDCNYVENNIGAFADVYYSCLVEELKKHGLNSSELPKEEFLESLNWYRLPALVETVMYGTHIFISEALSNQIVADVAMYNEFSFINRSKFAVKEFRDNPQYRDRISAILTLLVETLANRL